MEPITDVKWDVVLGSTGLAESLLALSLSRSDKRILHLDHNGYYGGSEAALSLQDAEEWAQRVNKAMPSIFQDASIAASESDDAKGKTKLGFSRSYSLALAPQLIYCNSALIQALVNSKVYRQLEFLAVGTWWIFEASSSQSEEGTSVSGHLRRIPSRREDIFEDTSLDMKSKRAIIKFLRLIMDAEAQEATLREFGDRDLQSFLQEQFRIQPQLQAGLHALTLAPWPANRTPLSFALPRITRHLSSFGIFGPGFGAVIPRWGGLAEIAQVACRALAVGGGVYMLGNGIESHQTIDGEASMRLQSGEEVCAAYRTLVSGIQPEDTPDSLTRSISIIASKLEEVFPSLREGAPKPAAAVVCFKGSTFDPSIAEDVPIYLFIHSSDTGECPAGQSVIYASVGLVGEPAKDLLASAISHLLLSLGLDSKTGILWNMTYRQSGKMPKHSKAPTELPDAVVKETSPAYIDLPPTSIDLAFDDALLKSVKAAWTEITKTQNGFLEFEDREVGAYDSEEDG